MKKPLLFLLSVCCTTQFSTAQNVGINATGASPDGSAILDISSTDKGLLVPRVGLTSSTSNAPIGAGITTSLLVYVRRKCYKSIV